MFQLYFLLSLFVINYAESNFTSDCGKEGKIASYLDIAVEMINKVKSDMSAESNFTSDCSKKEKIASYLDFAVQMINKTKSESIHIENNITMIPVDCADVLRMGQSKSGVYAIQRMSQLTENKLLNVYCDMDTDGGGWTVIQRRGNYGNPKDEFFKEWKSYREGFGNIEKEFWLGNDIIFAMTNQRRYSARFDLQDAYFNKAYALYDYFFIDNEINNYTLHAGAFSGNAGDSLSKHNNQQFSTKDYGRSSYAKKYFCGWWYSDNRYTNLNGLYTRGENAMESVNWYSWKGNDNLESAEIKIRPKNFSV